MSLEITASPPKIRVTDTNGHVTFDSTNSLFHVTDALQGSVALGYSGAPPHSGTTEHTIGACDVNSTFVRGVMRCTYTGTPFAMFDAGGWFNVGGSFVQVAYVSGIRFWSFKAVAGVVKLVDFIAMHAIQNEFGQVLNTLGGITVHYDLLIGRFSP